MDGFMRFGVDPLLKVVIMVEKLKSVEGTLCLGMVGVYRKFIMENSPVD